MHPLVQDIERGAFDAVLEELKTAVLARIANQKLSDVGLAIGDKCRFHQNVRPKYLVDHGVEIVRIRENGEIIVKALAPRAHGRTFRVRPTQLLKA